MSFVFDTDSEGILEKLHARGVSVPVLVGVICVIAIVLVLLGQGLWGIVSGGAFGSHASGIEIAKSDSGDSDSQGLASQDSDTRNDSSQVSDSPSEADGSLQDGSDAGAASSVSDKTELCVDVAGEVKNPGLYRLKPGSRLDDAVRAAGGFTKKAERTSVNLAQPLEDGQQIVVLKKEAGSSASYAPAASSSGSSSSSGGSTASSSGSSLTGSSSGSSATTGEKVNINTASVEQLKALPGVGDATAQKIVADRDANGRFKKPEDIKRVSGIGDKKFEAMADMIAV